MKNLNESGSAVSPQPDAVITASEQISLAEGTTLTMPDPEFNKLRVNGAISILGRVELAIGRSVDKSDQVVATGNIFLARNKAEIVLRWADPTAGPPLGEWTQWLLFESLNGTADENDILESRFTFPAVAQADLKFTKDLSADQKKLHTQLRQK